MNRTPAAIAAESAAYRDALAADEAIAAAEEAVATAMLNEIGIVLDAEALTVADANAALDAARDAAEALWELAMALS